MKKLEERLRSPLFERIGRKSVPTELGLAFAQYGLTIKSAEKNANDYATYFSVGQAGNLILGTTPTLADNFLAPLLTKFLAQHTQCRIDLRVGLLNELETQLSVGQINIAIGPVRPLATNPQLETEILVEDMLGVVCQTGHALTELSEIRPRDLEAHRWITHSKGSYLRMQTEDALGRFGVKNVDIALETDSTETAYKVVAGANFITALPRLPTLLSDHADSICFLPLQNTAFQRPIGIIQRASHLRSSLESAFLHELQTVVSSIANKL